jgi:hypothetical protein
VVDVLSYVVGAHRVGEVVAAVDVAVEFDDALMLAEDVAGEVLSDLAGPEGRMRSQ